ncbi:MAG: hypothetical protein R3E96_06730 [Planctomycetota bacterium]
MPLTWWCGAGLRAAHPSRALQDPVMAQADGKAYAPRWLAGRFIEFVSPRSPKGAQGPRHVQTRIRPAHRRPAGFHRDAEFLIHALGAALPVD